MQWVSCEELAATPTDLSHNTELENKTIKSLLCYQQWRTITLKRNHSTKLLGQINKQQWRGKIKQNKCRKAQQQQSTGKEGIETIPYKSVQQQTHKQQKKGKIKDFKSMPVFRGNPRATRRLFLKRNIQFLLQCFRNIYYIKRNVTDRK